MERDRALQAENDAVVSRGIAEVNLKQALVMGARTAEEKGRRAHAEVLAAEALALGDDPDARGVLAGFGVHAPLSLSKNTPLPGCDRGVLGPDRVACLGSEVSIRRVGDGVTTQVAEGPAEKAVFSSEGLVISRAPNSLFLLADHGWVDVASARHERTLQAPNPGGVAVTGGGEHLWISLDTMEVTPRPGCPRGIVSLLTYAPGGDDWAVTCGVGGGVWLKSGQPLPMPANEVVALGWAEAGVLVSRVGGGLEVYDQRGQLVRRMEAELAGGLVSRGNEVALAVTGGDVEVWDVTMGRRLGQIPRVAQDLRWTDGGLQVLSRGEVSHWRIGGAPSHPKGLSHPSGIAGLDVRAGLVATGHGDGSVRLVDLDGGQTLWEHTLRDAVTKDVALSPDGTQVVAVSVGPSGLVVFDRSGNRQSWGEQGYRRVEWTKSGVVGLPYAQELHRLQGALAIDPLAASLFDSDVVGNGFVARDREGGLWRFQDGERVSVGVDGDATAITGFEDQVLVAHREALLHHDGEDWQEMVVGGSPILDVAWHSAGQFWATAHLDGSARVFDPKGKLLMVVKGHEGRVSQVRFDGQMLATAGWDGVVKFWDLDVLALDASRHREAVSARWGLSLEQALGSL